MPEIRIDEEELLVAMGGNDGTMRWFLDRQSGAVIPLSEDNRMEEDDEIWEAIEADDGRYLEIPSTPSREGFAMMEDFIATLEPGAASGALERALRGRRPFRAFKDALGDFPDIRVRWFVYEAEELRRAAVDWLHVEGIDAELVPFTPAAERARPAE